MSVTCVITSLSWSLLSVFLIVLSCDAEERQRARETKTERSREIKKRETMTENRDREGVSVKQGLIQFAGCV